MINLQLCVVVSNFFFSFSCCSKPMWPSFFCVKVQSQFTIILGETSQPNSRNSNRNLESCLVQNFDFGVSSALHIVIDNRQWTVFYQRNLGKINVTIPLIEIKCLDMPYLYISALVKLFFLVKFLLWEWKDMRVSNDDSICVNNCF